MKIRAREIHHRLRNREPGQVAEEYSEEQFDLNYPDGAEHHYWNVARNRIVERTLGRLVPRPGYVLDVGCGRGIVVQHLRRSGMECWGVEPARTRPLKGAAGYMKAETWAEDLPSEERSRVDTILLLDVIEHIQDPVRAMRSLVAAFPRLRHFLVAVPARSELWSNYDDYFGHFRRYDPEMIESLAAELGLEAAWHRYFFHSLYLPTRLFAKLSRPRPIETKAPEGLMRVIHRIVGASLVAEDALLPGAVLGTSLMACLSTAQRSEATP